MLERRILFLAALFGLFFLVLLGRLAHLQIYRAEAWKQRGEMRRHTLKQVPPARGRIFDRTGRILAEDQISFDLWLIPAYAEKKKGEILLQGLLGELTPGRLMEIAQSQGPKRNLEIALAKRYLSENDPLVTALLPLLPLSREEIVETLLQAALFNAESSEIALSHPRPCFHDIPPSAYFAILQAKGNPYSGREFDAIEPRLSFQRRYPAGETMAHITGVVGKLTAEQLRTLRGYWDGEGNSHPGKGVLEEDGHLIMKIEPASDEEEILALRERVRAGKVERYAGYLANETIGLSGIERYYNEELRGKHRLQLQRLERTPVGGKLRFVDVEPRVPVEVGKDVTLTVDLELQSRVRSIVKASLTSLRRSHGREYQGVCILLHPETGEIRALVSEPSFDPNTYSKDFDRLQRDPLHPLINLAICGAFPPGSVMKPIVALAALESRAISPFTEFVCEKVIRLGDREYRCLGLHGSITVEDAIKRSCNIFFYHAAAATGSRRIYEMADKLGLGLPTGIDLSGEKRGHLPWRAYIRRNWSLGETYHLGIGQGAVDVTPIQIAVAIAAIANGGKIVRPHLRYDPDDPSLSNPRRLVKLDAAALETVRRGMWKVVQEPGGTAYNRARLSSLTIAGKTGSAQHTRGTHAWFACYAPFENPEIVCVVLVPFGNFGGETCAPIARRVLAAYFGLPEEEETPEREEEEFG